MTTVFKGYLLIIGSVSIASGKSTLGKYFFKKFKKQKKNTVFFDGDEFRKIFHDDIDRKSVV